MPSIVTELDELESRQIDRLTDLADGVINDRERWVHHAPVCDGLVKLGLAEIVGSSGSQLSGYKGVVLYRITPKGADLFRNEWWHQMLVHKLDALPHEPVSIPKPYYKTVIGGVLLAVVAAGIAAGAALPRFVGDAPSAAGQSQGRPPAAVLDSKADGAAAGTRSGRCVSTPSMPRKCPEHPSQRVS